MKPTLREVLKSCVRFARRLEVRLRDRSTVPFGRVLSPQQEEVLNALQDEPRVAIAKARQLGMTTACRAYAVWKAVTTPGYHAGLLSNKMRGAKEISRIDARMLDGLGKVFPDLIASANQTEVVLTNGSRLLYFSGKSSNDRGYTLDFLHVTEYAHVDDGADLLATLLQSVPAHGRVVIESTPSHYGDPLHKVAENGGGAWKLLFFPWTVFAEYRRPLPEGFKRTEDEAKLTDLDDEQVAWRRFKIDELGGDAVAFRREFPISLEEAYALAEGAWLDEDTANRIKPVRYEETWEGPVGSGFRVQTLRPYDPSHAYIIGYDPAGGVGLDYSVAVVLDRHTRDVVQVVSSNRRNVADFSERVGVASGGWGKAHVLCEWNNHGQRAVNTLEKAGVPVEKWNTTARTKLDVLELLRNRIHTETLGNVDLDTAQELRTMARQPNGHAPAAKVGHHDDRVMALALALQHDSAYPAVTPKKSWAQAHMDDMMRPKPRHNIPTNPLR